MKLISDIQYFAPVIFYYTLSECTHCIFDQYEHFQKMSFRNRCTLPGGNGPITLSIPIIGGRGLRAPMKDVRILNKENWQARHWKTIMSCYNKSPWFGHYAHELEELYSRKFEFLIDWNLECFKWVTDKLAIKTPWSLSDSYVPKYDAGEYLDWRGELIPATINEKYPATKRYPQVFEDRFGFVPNLSVLDYLFCTAGKI